MTSSPSADTAAALVARRNRLGRCLLQHGPGRGPGTAHRAEEMAQAARTVGVLVAIARLVAGGLGHADHVPVCLQLVRHDHRDGGAHALPHLGTVDAHGDDTVLGDRHEDVRIVTPAVGHRVGAELDGSVLCAARAGQSDGKNQAAGPHAQQQGPAADIGDAGGFGNAVRHHSVLASAACLMAARMRG